MDMQTNPEIYKACEHAFVRELARTVTVIVDRVPSLALGEKSEFVSSLTFAVAAHLSGSSFGGRVENDEIYPKLGFWKGESDEALHFGDGCRLHELVPSVLCELATVRVGSSP